MFELTRTERVTNACITRRRTSDWCL